MKLGLSEKEAKVYLATLELAQDTVQNISKKSGVNRPTTYVILEKLMQMGLISKVEKEKRTLFIAEDPRELENLLEKQNREIEDKKDELKAIMDELKALNNTNREKPVVKYFEGRDGLITMDKYGRDQIKHNQESLALIPIGIVESLYPERREQAIKERVQAHIKSKSIYTKNGEDISSKQDQNELRESIRISKDLFPLTGTISVFPGWGIKLFNFNQQNPHGVTIESKELANNMKVLYELAWLGAQHLDKNK